MTPPTTLRHEFRPIAPLSMPNAGGQVALARGTYRPSQQMNFYVDPAEGHDAYLVSLELTIHAASKQVTEPRIARGRVPVSALN